VANIVRKFSVPATTTSNVVSGSAFEYPQQPSQLSLAINGGAAAMFCTLYAGSRLIAEEFELNISAAYPIVPDQFYFNFPILPGERLVVNVRNSTAGPLVAWFVIDMQTIGR
jgi:hypothetical protein